MKDLVAVVLAGILLASWSPVSSGAEPEIDIAWEAVRTLLSWEKHWYGSFRAERCYKRWVGKRVPVTFHKFNPDALRAQRLPARPCAGADKSAPHVETIRVQIGDTVLKYSVVAGSLRAGGLRTKAIAGFIDPVATDDDGCRDLEADRWKARYRKAGIPEVLETRLLPGVETYLLPPVAENLTDALVIHAVQGKMAYFRPPRLTDLPSAGRPPESVSPERLVQARGTRIVVVGRFRRSDPALLLWYLGDDTVYRMGFPGPDVLADENMCILGDALPPSAMPLSKDELRVQRLLKQKLRKDSIMVEVPTSPP